MTAIASLYAEQALRLANERQADYRSEAERFRLAALAGRGSRFEGLTSRIASIRDAIARIGVVPVEVPRLSNYPYRG